eukprot:2317762-Lingulodinium_polyedra.AAC.1
MRRVQPAMCATTSARCDMQPATRASKLRPPRAWMGRAGPLDQRAPRVDDIGHPVDTDGPH